MMSRTDDDYLLKVNIIIHTNIYYQLIKFVNWTKETLDTKLHFLKNPCKLHTKAVFLSFYLAFWFVFQVKFMH